MLKNEGRMGKANLKHLSVQSGHVGDGPLVFSPVWMGLLIKET